MHFKPGMTMGSALLNIGDPSDAAMWKLTIADKTQLYGNNACPQSTDDYKSNYPVRNDGDTELDNNWQMSAHLCEELLWRMNTNAVLDHSCCVDMLAICCLELSIMYAGICFTPSGVDFLKTNLVVVVFHKFLDDASPLYKPTLAQPVNRI